MFSIFKFTHNYSLISFFLYSLSFLNFKFFSSSSIFFVYQWQMEDHTYTNIQKVNSLATNTQKKKNPSKFYSNFRFKDIIVTLLLVLKPFFTFKSS